MRGFWIGIFIALSSLWPPVAAAQNEVRRYYSGFAGAMTEGRWHEALRPGRLEFAESGLIGGTIGWERRIGTSRFSYGIEAQVVGHFGRQDHFEFNLPVTLRYHPERPLPRALSSAAFGVGVSHATKVPQVEIDRRGASQRNYVYWMGELEFATRRPGRTAFVRLHHRSDGYGLYEASSGSTAWVFGLRMSF